MDAHAYGTMLPFSLPFSREKVLEIILKKIDL